MCSRHRAFLRRSKGELEGDEEKKQFRAYLFLHGRQLAKIYTKYQYHREGNLLPRRKNHTPAIFLIFDLVNVFGSTSLEAASAGFFIE